MEQKDINKLLIGGIVLSCVVSVAAATFSFTTYRKLAAAEDLRSDAAKEVSANIDLGPVSFAGFAGRPTVATTDTKGETKVFKLRGHAMQDPKASYEFVSEKDVTVKDVIIDRNTKLYSIVKGEKYPKVSGIEFDQFTIDSMDNTYVVSYEAREGESITDTTPATSVSIFAK